MKITFQNSPDVTMDKNAINRQQTLQQSAQGFHGVDAGRGFGRAYKLGADDRSMDKLIAGVGSEGSAHGGIDSMAMLQQMAGAVDASVQQDYMTLMSNTMSDEDYAQFVRDGFDPKDMDPAETVTILDKIKAEMAKAGKQVAGYNDDLDVEMLKAALGSENLAQAVSKSFSERNLPLSEEMERELKEAWQMASSLTQPTDGAYQYMLRGDLEPSIADFYLAENSGAGAGSQNGAMFYEAGVQGYYAQAGVAMEGTELDARFQEQVDQVIRQAGYEVTEESREEAKWLLDRKLPLTADKLESHKILTDVSFPVGEENFAEAAAEAVLEGRSPKFGNLSGENRESIYVKANRILEEYDRTEMEDRRLLEEIRLHMTAEVNVKLLRSGFAIDTAPMEELVEALKAAERQVAESYFPKAEDAVSKYQAYRETNQIVKELPQMPAKLLGVIQIGEAKTGGQLGEEQNPTSLSEACRAGQEMRREMEAAREKYETLMTAPRADLGDSIRRAFANVDDILADLGYEASEENRKAVRVLGYNRMELNPENIDRVRDAQRIVMNVTEKMTPAAVLKMIRDDVNPLEKSFEELQTYFDDLSPEYQEASESYGRFLCRMEQSGEVTPEERESYVGIYRMLHQIEKKDSSSVGMVLNTGAELSFDNLLAAARAGNVGFYDVRLTDQEETYVRLVKGKDSIDDQIEAAFRQRDRLILQDASKASGEARELLQNAGLTSTASYLQAAEELLSEEAFPFGRLTERRERDRQDEASLQNLKYRSERDDEADIDPIQNLEKLWERAGEPDFSTNCQEALTKAEEFVKEQTFAMETSLDVRQMQLLSKQLHVAGSLADGGQEFYLPLEYEGGTGKLHLKLEHAENEQARAVVEVNAFGSKTRAEFQLKDGKVSATLWGQGEEEVTKLTRAADILSDRLAKGSSLRLDERPTVIDLARSGEGRAAGQRGRGRTDQLSEDNGAMKSSDGAARERIPTEALLGLAKEWIKAVTQKEAEYEN